MFFFQSFSSSGALGVPLLKGGSNNNTHTRKEVCSREMKKTKACFTVVHIKTTAPLNITSSHPLKRKKSDDGIWSTKGEEGAPLRVVPLFFFFSFHSRAIHQLSYAQLEQWSRLVCGRRHYIRARTTFLCLLKCDGCVCVCGLMQQFHIARISLLFLSTK